MLHKVSLHALTPPPSPANVVTAPTQASIPSAVNLPTPVPSPVNTCSKFVQTTTPTPGMHFYWRHVTFFIIFGGYSLKSHTIQSVKAFVLLFSLGIFISFLDIAKIMYYLKFFTDKRLWCKCRKGSFGTMIACDNAACETEWYHIECIGLAVPPDGEWYCPKCAN